jgi:aldose 1-epimerase
MMTEEPSSNLRVVSATLVELRSSGVIVRIAPDEGGRVVSLVVGGQERILQKPNARPSALATGWGCYPMIPWAGRLSQGRIPVDGGEVRLEQNRPPSSIHGLVFDKPWRILSQSDTAVTMVCELRGLGWPFGGEARQTLRLAQAYLDLELEVGGYMRPGPAGVGWHPWFARPETGDVQIRVDAREVLVLDADLVPTGAVRAVAAVEDLRTGPALADRRLDHVYVNSHGPALIRWPDLDLALEYGDDLATVVVHTPSHGFCVEPQTMWPNAPLLAAQGVAGTGLRTLAPGEHLRTSHRWSWRTRALR